MIGAVGAGKQAAESIDRYLNGEDMWADRFEASIKPLPPELLPTTKGKEKIPRAVQIHAVADRTASNFNEVEDGLTEEPALAEAERCLNCALCSECLQCVTACEQNAIDHCMKERSLSWMSVQ